MQPDPRPTAPPSSYVVEHHTQQCSHCDSSHNYTRVYACHTSSATARRLIPVSRPADITWDIPIDRRSAPTERIPFCHACAAGVTLGHLRKPPRLVDPHVPLHSPLQPTAAKVKPAKRPFTLDDL